MSYPPPPWITRGRAWIQPYLVDGTQLRLPPGFAPVTLAGRAVGVLGLVIYEPPSPLTYAELIWMPCLAQVATTERRARGYFVEKMYVDSQASLEGGRELWALPKQLARFQLGEREAIVDTEDGAHLVLELGHRGPGLRAPVAAATLQARATDVVRFRGSGTAQLGLGRLRLREARGLDTWMGWTGARRVPGLGAHLRGFDITMHAPKLLARS